MNGGLTVTRAVQGACFNRIRLSQFTKEPPAARLVIDLTGSVTPTVTSSRSDGKITIRLAGESSPSSNLLAPPTTPPTQTGDIAGSLNAVQPAHADGKDGQGKDGQDKEEETAPPPATAPVSTGPVPYQVVKDDKDVTVRIKGIDASKLTIEKLRFPDRLHIRMFTKDPVDDSQIRFDRLDQGDIYNGIAKNWSSLKDRNNLGVYDLEVYMFPGISFSQSTDQPGEVDVKLFKSASVAPLPPVEPNPPAHMQTTVDHGQGQPPISGQPTETANQGVCSQVSPQPPAGTGPVVPPSNSPTQPAESAPPAAPPSKEISTNPIYMRVGDLKIIQTNNLVRASTGNPAIATLNVISTSELLVTALATGSTTLLTWEEGGAHTTRDIYVLDATAAREDQLTELIDNPDISVRVVMQGTTPAVVLEGAVKTEEERTNAESIADLYAGGKDKVTDLIEITNPVQVMVKVRVVEIDKTAIDSRVSQLNTAVRANNDDFTFGIITDLLDPSNPGGGLMDTRVRPGIVNGNAKDLVFDPIDAALNALKSNSEANVLSEPNVIAMSGHAAHFRVGGEIPYTYQNSQGTNVVDFKEFGIQLDMTPTADSNGNVMMKVAPTVRTVDQSLAVAGVPGFRTREMTTDVQLKDGETLVIGGLIQHDITKLVAEVPLLSSIPILGGLFKSKKFNDDETELVIFLTPYIITSPEQAQQIVGAHPDQAPPLKP